MMLSRIALLTLCLSATPLVALADKAPPGPTERVAAAQAAFGLSLFSTVAPTGNAVVSPQSVFEALAMTSAGAAADTLEAMRKTLAIGFPEDQLHVGMAALRADRAQRAALGFQLKLANRLFVHRSLELVPAFAALAEASYGAELGRVDFVADRDGARKTINDWVLEQTNGRIKELVQSPDLTPNTRLVLANAIWFKADWRHKFDRGRTHDAVFLVDGKTAREVSTMHQTLSVRYARAAGAQWLELPYGRSSGMTFVIGLPDAPDGLPALRKALTPATLEAAIGKLGTERVALALPKFKLEARFLLADALTALGMGVAFTQKADFTRMAKPKDPAEHLLIEKVIHQAFVEVNETGTEAAAATAVMMGGKGAMPPEAPPIPFKVDHPFVFLLRDSKTGELLFVGQVTEPKA